MNEDVQRWRVEEFTLEMRSEYRRAREKHAPMHSLHEGMAVLWEEFEEMKAEVFKKHPDLHNLRAELIQIAAMAMAMSLEVCK